jgi:hypothetical protein
LGPAGRIGTPLSDLDLTAQWPSSSREHARRGEAGELARVWGMAVLTEGHWWLVGGRSMAEVFREWSGSRFAACRG